MLKNRETASPKFPDNARNREITGKGSRISSYALANPSLMPKLR